MIMEKKLAIINPFDIGLFNSGSGDCKSHRVLKEIGSGNGHFASQMYTSGDPARAKATQRSGHASRSLEIHEWGTVHVEPVYSCWRVQKSLG